MSKLDVVVVAYGSAELLEQCLSSLAEHPASGGQHIIVADNGPGDDAATLIRRAWRDVELVPLGGNRGFAVAANAGIASGRAPYVLVLNPDVAVRRRTLDTMIALLDEHADVGIAGCRLERADGSFDHAARRSFPTPLAGLAHLLGVGRGRVTGPLAQYRAPGVEQGAVDAVNGAFMLVRRAALDDVGAFDEGFWMYMEDLDLCYRFGQAGWITWYEPSVSALHLKGATASRATSPRLTWAFYRSMRRFVRLHRELVQPPLLRPLVSVGIVVLGAAATLVAGARLLGRRGDEHAPRDSRAR